MLTNNLRYELKILIRNRWLFVFVFSILTLFSFAIYNGTKNVAKRQQDISTMKQSMHQKDSTMLSMLTKIEKGEKLDIPYWQLPSEPMTVGNRYPRLTIMPPNSFSFIATGQSDMYTHFKSSRIYQTNFSLDYSEMINPIQLLFGNFDLAFVIIYILPLLIIAFTFNILSKEKELGTLRLLSSQPVSIKTWLLQKLIIRFVLFTILTSAVLLVTMSVFSTNIFSDLGNLFGIFLILIGYILFWFVIAYIINIKVNDSSKNALSLIAIWLLVVIVLPATINQIGNSLYPTPSRLKMINTIRQIKKENEAQQNKILSDYLRDHPELTQGSDQEKFGFWHNYFASEKLMEEKTKPLLTKYESQLKKQQNLINTFKYASPAILIQQTLNNIAGTSEKHYNNYKKQVSDFSNTWRNYLIPMLFKNQKFTSKHYKEMPVFIYQNNVLNNTWFNFFILLVICGLLILAFTRKHINGESLFE